MPMRIWTEAEVRDYRRRYLAGEYNITELANRINEDRNVVYRMLRNKTYYDATYTPPDHIQERVLTSVEMKIEEAVITYMRDYMIATGGAAPTLRQITDATGRQFSSVEKALQRLVKKGKLEAVRGRRVGVYRIPGKWYPVRKGLFDGLDDD